MVGGRSKVRIVPALLAILTSCFLAGGLYAKPAKKEKPEEKKPEGGLPTISEKTGGLARQEGLFDLYLDDKGGKVYLALPAPSERGQIAEVLYSAGLENGLGSNPTGLDRGLLSDTQLLRLRRVGNKVLFEQPNTLYRATTENVAELAAVSESFATSVLWAGEIAAADKEGASLVDVTGFLLRDQLNVARTLKAAGQGDYELDADRSAVDVAGALAFPENVELRSTLTFASDEPGPLIPEVAPDGSTVSLVVRHSLIRLPEPGFQTRRSDQRMGLLEVGYSDFGAPLDQPLEQRLAWRFRLEKTDPTAARSTVKKPIVFYIDSGAPEPIRSALVEGASWWGQAFDAAGFIDAYKVEVLPADKHPLDVRYNVVQWVHRSTRGWSYGGGIVDPRTGEILKGHVRLGSQRIRQDRLLIEGLAGTERTGTGAPDDPVQIALARIRQLSAHEVGHSLGIGHNFAASTYGDRASVMDYPAPQVSVDANGKLDFSRAYAVGAGAWDKHAVRYLYSQLPEGADEAAALDAIVREGLAKGYLYIGDPESRPGYSSDARSNLWDNGEDPVTELKNAVKVRAIGLQYFGERNVRPGTPLSQLREVFGPLYLHHRYQLEAAAKLVGGMEHHYAVRGDGLFATRLVDAARQRRALAAIVDLLDPAFLDIPEPALALFAPPPSLLRPREEVLGGFTRPAFDPIAAAETATAMVLDSLLLPERLARMEVSRHRQADLPDVAEVLKAVADKAFVDASAQRRSELQRAIQRVVVGRLMRLVTEQQTTVGVQAQIVAALEAIRDVELQRGTAHDRYLANEIVRFQERPHAPTPQVRPPAEPIPGSPIGTDEHLADCSHGAF
jgi:hypothetical protein